MLADVLKLKCQLHRTSYLNAALTVVQLLKYHRRVDALTVSMRERRINRQFDSRPDAGDVTRVAVQQNGPARLVQSPVRPSGD